ncbi:M67 family metallopeptidase [Alkalinema sp. FACHB-956]|uniref:Mov34/MPN/PAD-1 family protein n=1 Tax=Alkalinema sp. FACHB-956 TaxID=2692768 RepID=UPI0016864585|nr:M67 family metallopeptidase [Alkalinema sp. FACHB-956]MBD2327554.1 M67 family metallopeptidase [Alkalinema sp. FACHB-956]
MLQISQNYIYQLTDWLEQAYPQEGCGLLLGKRQQDCTIVVELYPTENGWNAAVAELIGAGTGKTDRYWIDSAVMFQAMKKARSRQLEIVGVYHSHPDHPAIPSECDRRLAWADYSYVIASVSQGNVTDLQCWKLNGQHQFEPEVIQITRS